MTQNFNSNEIDLVTYARENFEDMTVENTELMTKGYFCRIWATAMLEFSSDTKPYQKVIQDTKNYDLDDAMENKDKKYIVKLVSRDLNDLNEYNEEMEKVRKNNKVEIVYENDNGYVAKINR